MLKNAFYLGLILILTGCADPLRDMPRLSDVDLIESDPARQALPSEVEIARADFLQPESDFAYRAAMAKPAEPAAARGGFWGMLRRAAQPAATDVTTDLQPLSPVEDVTTEDASVANVAPVIADVAEPAVEKAHADKPRSTGFFDRLITPVRFPATSGAGYDGLEVSYGTLLPTGVVARVCEARLKPMGRKVETAAASGFKVYDSAPNTAGARTYYITGFDDGCPRQLTAAHVLFGAPSFYELLHYGPTGAHLSAAETDQAYERVKSKVCGARKGKPCGARMRQLERSTVFINAYARMDDNTQWSELLVHDGAVIATALKTN